MWRRSNHKETNVGGKGGWRKQVEEKRDLKEILEMDASNVIGEGSHRRLSTSIKIQTQRANSASELSSFSCQFIILERLPSGVFADPFELQHLVQRGVFRDIAVFGDTNLELPSFLSNRSSVEIHLDVDQNILLDPTDIKVELPLHARYQPLNESGYSTVEFGAPDILMRCSKKENVENQSCFVKVVNDANSIGADIVWKIPSGRKAHAQLVYTVDTSTWVSVIIRRRFSGVSIRR
ncbi:Phosphatidylinositol-glycan biosynthesis class X protein [Senna tora]|uniref:Phosphatidylinositol-glycan biosynthesis class X protein n=1 Tax=Senna tora TaxID=362788 RepID=A0A834SJA7_9FABA|nr:Phosphatidylinositol-glycan biosynthesis class X protein [Senna tora]